MQNKSNHVKDMEEDIRLAHWDFLADESSENLDNYLAKALTDKGYRLASDVAREIFEEIEREIKNHGICYTQRKIYELKKKRTEGEG